MHEQRDAAATCVIRGTGQAQTPTLATTHHDRTKASVHPSIHPSMHYVEGDDAARLSPHERAHGDISKERRFHSKRYPSSTHSRSIHPMMHARGHGEDAPDNPGCNPSSSSSLIEHKCVAPFACYIAFPQRTYHEAEAGLEVDLAGAEEGHEPELRV